jgi:hypothetical protein
VISADIKRMGAGGLLIETSRQVQHTPQIDANPAEHPEEPKLAQIVPAA